MSSLPTLNELRESLYTQPLHDCLAREPNPFEFLEPPHHGTDGKVQTTVGEYQIYPDSGWTLHIDTTSTPVSFCPWCGVKLPIE